LPVFGQSTWKRSITGWVAWPGFAASTGAGFEVTRVSIGWIVSRFEV